MQREYYVYINKEQLGPVDGEKLKELDLTPDTLVWYDGLDEWVPASEAPGIQWLFNGEPEPEIADDTDTALQRTPDETSVAGETEDAGAYNDEYLPEPPRTHIAWAVILTIIGAGVFGILAIVFYSVAKTRYNNGQYDLAEHSAGVGNRWLSWAVPFAILGLLYTIFVFKDLMRSMDQLSSVW